MSDLPDISGLSLGDKKYNSLCKSLKPSKSSKPVPILPPTNDIDPLKPISVKSKAWGRKIDLSKVHNAGFASYAKSKVKPTKGKEGEGFLDHPDQYNAKKKAIDQLMALAEKAESLAPVNPADKHVDGLNISLLDHQVRSLKFFLEEERSDKLRRGGLLCDDMGLGKTVQMLALILSNPAKDLDDLTEIRDAYLDDKDLDLVPKDGADKLVSIKSTLLICPASLMSQWETEILTKTNLSVLTFHGPKRTRKLQDLAKYDVVITSYQTCMHEYNSGVSPIYQCYWWRVILDEAHMIKNTGSKMAVACFHVKSLRRWCLTGTPIQNDIGELGALFHFLRINEYWDTALWRRQINKKFVAGNSEVFDLLSQLLKRSMVRRKKSVLDGEYKLPKKHHHKERLEQATFERKIYEDMEKKGLDQFFKETKLKSKRPVNEHDKSGQNMYMVAFVYLLRLRQLCDHWQILFDKDSKEVEESFMTRKEKSQFKDLDLSELFSSMSLVETPKDNGSESAKVDRVIEILSKDRTRKTIVFSEFTSMLDILEDTIEAKGFQTVRYDGKMSKVEKDRALAKVKNDEKCTVLLCSLKCGSLGLNLTFCSQVILYEPFWNPAVGDQAIDRVYRIGQTKPVDVYEFFLENTVESRIRDLQDRKRKVAKAVADSDAQSASDLVNSRLSVGELMKLAGLSTYQ